MRNKQSLDLLAVDLSKPRGEIARAEQRSSNSWLDRFVIDRRWALKIFLVYISGLTILLAADYGASVFAQEFLNGRSQVPSMLKSGGQGPPHANANSSRMGSSINKGVAATKQPVAPLQPIDQAVGDWRVQCQVQPQRFCRAFQMHVNQANQSLLLKFEVALPAGASNGFTYSVLTPLGLKLSAGLSIESDQGAPLTLPILTCRPDGCVYLLNDQAGALKSIWSSKILSAQLVSLDGKVGAIGISVRGLAEARAMITNFMSR